MARRSVLFTPGDDRSKLEGAATTDADVLVFDLEDGVAPARIEQARETVADVLDTSEFDPDAELLVRVHPFGTATATDADPLRADLRALAPAADAIDGLVLPKARSGEEIRRLAGLSRRHGLPRTVLAIVETAAGVQAAPDIAAAGATDGVIVGTEDLAADVGSTPDDERTEAVYARQRVVTAAAAAGVDAIDTLWTDFRDETGLRTDAQRAVALGFDGKLAIHPAQIGPINEAFVPESEEREWAARVIAAAGEGGAVAVDGEMIDAPLVRRAERIAERARAAGLPIGDLDRGP